MSENKKTPFWLLSYGSLIWDRTISAFVPMSILQGVIDEEVINKFQFFNEDEIKAQISELKALGVHEPDMHVKVYTRTQRLK